MATDLYAISQRINERLGVAGYPGGSVDAPDSASWDFALGNLKFLYATSDQDPYLRETSEFRRERIDTATNPGEQSLDSGYWVRSQESWHYGGGLRNAEPLEITAAEYRFRYQDSGGVDPWIAGKLTLLNDTERIVKDPESFSLLGTTEGVVLYNAAGVTLLDDDGGEVWSYANTTIYSLTTDGDNFYAGTIDGKIIKGDLETGAAAEVHDFAKAENVLVRWVKGRIIACVGNAVYEGAGDVWNEIDSGATLPDEFTWKDVAEGPVAIYLAGHAGVQSSIYKIEVTVAEGVVELSPLILVAEMPRGELVNTMYSYVGAFLAIGTSDGARIAGMQANGTLDVGPIVRQSESGVHDFVAYGSYLYAAVGEDGSAGARVKAPGLVRMNLGQTLNDQPLMFAHANDLTAPGTMASCTSVTTRNGKLVMGMEGDGVYRQSDLYVKEGWLETGRIRLGTTEKKTFRDLRLLGEPGMQGGVVGYTERETDRFSPAGWNPVVAIGGERYDRTGKISSNPNEPSTSLYVAIQLLATEDQTMAPVVQSYQLRAIPSPERTRLLRIPVLMQDTETDKTGQVLGYDGYAWDRVQLLEALEQEYALTPYHDFTTGEKVNVYIERVTWRRTTPPKHNSGNAGGVATILARIV
jgi:hypothetical protein